MPGNNKTAAPVSAASYRPETGFLQQVLGVPVQRVQAIPLKHSSTPAVVYHLLLDGPGCPPRLILKRVAPGWLEDPAGYEREARFYATLLPRLDMPAPRVYYAGPEPDTGHQLILLEDVSATHRFPPVDHLWQMDEVRPAMHTYARLHASGTEHLPPADERDWMFPPLEKRVQETAGELAGMVAAIVQRGIWQPLPGFERLLARLLAQLEAFASEPATVLHLDVYPPNLALPHRPEDPVLLFDWEMVTWGLPEIDLGYMFFQPYGSHRLLDRPALMALYWQERAGLDGRMLSPAEQAERLAYVDALWAVWTTPVAHRMALEPYPAGSAPRRYWNHMFHVLEERLHHLTGRVRNHKR